MKFFLSFAGVLVAILLFIRFVPSAPINPVLPVGPQKEVNGHNSEVPDGMGDEAPTETPKEEGIPSTSIPSVAPSHTYGAATDTRATTPMSALNTRAS